ncbi:hypothetical protein [Lysinibacillus sp. TE18511]
MSFEAFQRSRALKVLNTIRTRGVVWQENSAPSHLEKRIDLGHLPTSAGQIDYDKKILDILNKDDNELFLHAQDDSFVFGDGEWIVIIVAKTSEIITSFPPNFYERYLSDEKGYEYLGSIEEVRNAKIS